MEVDFAKKITDFYGPWLPACHVTDDTRGYMEISWKSHGDMMREYHQELPDGTDNVLLVKIEGPV